MRGLAAAYRNEDLQPEEFTFFDLTVAEQETLSSDAFGQTGMDFVVINVFAFSISQDEFKFLFIFVSGVCTKCCYCFIAVVSVSYPNCLACQRGINDARRLPL